MVDVSRHCVLKGRVIEPKQKSRSIRGARRTRVLEVAARTLNRIGVSTNSLPSIAEELGVSRAALYYYFEDQEDLVFQSYRRSCEILAQHLNDAARTSSDSMSTIVSFVDRVLGPDAPEFASLSDLAYLREERRSTIMGLIHGIRSSIADVLEAGHRKGELRSCSSGIIAAAILGLVSWRRIARTWRSNDPLSDQDLIEAAKSLLRLGIANDRAAPIHLRPMELPHASAWSSNVFDAVAVVEAKQESLLAAASWLFNLKGIDATSLDEIAARLGVTKKVIYHNLGDKQKLVEECFRRSFTFYEEITDRTGGYDGSRLAAITASTYAFAEANLREDIAPLAPLSGVEGLAPAVLEELNRSADRMMDAFLAHYAQGQKEGSIRHLNSRAVIAVNPGIWEWLPKWYETLTESERAIAPSELAELNRIGLLAI